MTFLSQMNDIVYGNTNPNDYKTFAPYYEFIYIQTNVCLTRGQWKVYHLSIREKVYILTFHCVKHSSLQSTVILVFYYTPRHEGVGCPGGIVLRILDTRLRRVASFMPRSLCPQNNSGSGEKKYLRSYRQSSPGCLAGNVVNIETALPHFHIFQPRLRTMVANKRDQTTQK